LVGVCISSFEFGFRAIMTALENEVGVLEREQRQKAIKQGFWKRAELALTDASKTRRSMP
jgi:hypothetical protein